MSNDSLFTGSEGMSVFEVTYGDGGIVEVEAWTPVIAEAIAEEEAEMNGHPLPIAGVKFLRKLPLDE